ncbi:MAG: hypothetical protein ACRDRL_28980 [Sciscionella sp.]
MVAPHVETVLHDWLAPAFPAARVCTETPADLADVLPCLRVVGIGGSGDAYGFDSPHVDVDVFAATRSAARDLAQQVSWSLLHDLPGQMVAGTFVLSASEFLAPTWTPYDNTTLRRFVLSVGLRMHTRSVA